MKDGKTWKCVLGPAGWLCVIALCILSLTPADEMVRTDLGGRDEHVLAYAVTALLLGLAYSDRTYGLALAGSGLVAYGGALELLQHFSPGRSPAVVDWFASSVGAGIGTVSAWLAARRGF